jgi:hypothetical protein
LIDFHQSPSKFEEKWDGVLFHQSWLKFLIKDFFDRCDYQSFIKNFVKVFFDKENFDSDYGP